MTKHASGYIIYQEISTDKLEWNINKNIFVGT